MKRIIIIAFRHYQPPLPGVCAATDSLSSSSLFRVISHGEYLGISYSYDYCNISLLCQDEEKDGEKIRGGGGWFDSLLLLIRSVSCCIQEDDVEAEERWRALNRLSALENAVTSCKWWSDYATVQRASIAAGYILSGIDRWVPACTSRFSSQCLPVLLHPKRLGHVFRNEHSWNIYFYKNSNGGRYSFWANGTIKIHETEKKKNKSSGKDADDKLNQGSQDH